MKSRNIFAIIGAVITAVAAIAGIAYLVYRYIEQKNCLCDDIDYCIDDCCIDDDCCCCDEADDGEIEQ